MRLALQYRAAVLQAQLHLHNAHLDMYAHVLVRRGEGGKEEGGGPGPGSVLNVVDSLVWLVGLLEFNVSLSQ